MLACWFLPVNEEMSANELMQIIGGIARGLEYMHRKGFIHRDIKPANVLLTRDKEVGRTSEKTIDTAGDDTTAGKPDLAVNAFFKDSRPASKELLNMPPSLFVSLYSYPPPSLSFSPSLKAKLGDFGLVWRDEASRQGPTSGGQQGEGERTQVMGAAMYADPEYVRTGRPTLASDVYRYGPVALGSSLVQVSATRMAPFSYKCLFVNVVAITIVYSTLHKGEHAAVAFPFMCAKDGK